MKKLFIVLAAVAIATTALLLSLDAAKAVKPSDLQIPKAFTVTVTIHPSADSWCLANCIKKVGVWTSRGEVQTQDFVYGTWVYTFKFIAPLEKGWVAAGLTTIPNCCPSLTIEPALESGSWYGGDNQALHIYIH